MESKGIKLLSAGLAAVLVICACTFTYVKLTGKPVRDAAEAVYTPVSKVDTFSIDYEMYGNITTGDNTLHCDITNSVTNKNSTRIYLKDDTGVVSEYATLGVTEKCTLLKLSHIYTEPGEYEVTLLYEVIHGDKVSTISCPYVVLVNGGQS